MTRRFSTFRVRNYSYRELSESSRRTAAEPGTRNVSFWLSSVEHRDTLQAAAAALLASKYTVPRYFPRRPSPEGRQRAVGPGAMEILRRENDESNRFTYYFRRQAACTVHVRYVSAPDKYLFATYCIRLKSK